MTSAAKRRWSKLNRNVTILIVILMILLIAGYLLWLRSRFQKTDEDLEITPSPAMGISITPQPTFGVMGASPSATATPSSKASPTAKPIRTSTGSGSSVK